PRPEGAMRAFRLEVVTPDKVALNEDVVSVVAPGSEGSFGVLAGHAPMVAELTIGRLNYRTPGGAEEIMAISGGFLEVGRDHVMVLADSAERSTDIDVERALRALERAREQARLVTEQRDEAQLATQQAAITRAENRLRTVGRG